ncbi:MAG: hypoxanthine phosphoribosyltransferase [Chlamydiales bacterium]|nr:hypoxanthine phosphoribosyltransferase [Chlamydiales bacterium]
MKRLLCLFVALCGNCFAYNTDLVEIISAEQIAQRIALIAEQVDADYKGEDITIVMVMKGAVPVTADLMRQLKCPCTLEFIQTSSYKGGTTSGKLEMMGAERLNLEGKNVLVVDDIFDTGKTMATIVEKIQTQKNAKSVKSLVLLEKNSTKVTAYKPDYVCFNIPDEFVIGYGLDYDEYYRNLPSICTFAGGIPSNEE